MASVSETKIEVLTVTLKSEDVRNAIIEAARKEILASPQRSLPDLKWTPQIVEDGYGGFTVYFRRADASHVAKVA